MRIPVITPSLKYQHLMEVIRHAEREFERAKERQKLKKITKNEI